MALRYENEANEIVAYDENGVKRACLQFPAVNDKTVDVEHTVVDESLRGQGIGAELLEKFVVRMRDENKKAVITCPFAVKRFDEHPETGALVAEEGIMRKRNRARRRYIARTGKRPFWSGSAEKCRRKFAGSTSPLCEKLWKPVACTSTGCSMTGCRSAFRRSLRVCRMRFRGRE